MRPGVLAYSRDRPHNFSCPSAIRENLLLYLWLSKEEGYDTAAKAQWKAITPGQLPGGKVPSVQVGCGWFESCSCWLARECFWGEAQENVEELKSPVDYIVCCGKQSIALRGHRNKKRWIKQQFLASVVQVMVLELCCLTRKQDVQGISLLCSNFEPKLMLLLFWRISIAMIRKENKSIIFHPRSRMSWLTAQQSSALASASGCTRIKTMCSSTLPHSFHVSVSLLNEILPTNLTSWANSAKTSLLRVSCAPWTDVSGYAPAWQWAGQVPDVAYWASRGSIVC